MNWLGAIAFLCAPLIWAETHNTGGGDTANPLKQLTATQKLERLNSLYAQYTQKESQQLGDYLEKELTTVRRELDEKTEKDPADEKNIEQIDKILEQLRRIKGGGSPGSGNSYASTDGLADAMGTVINQSLSFLKPPVIPEPIVPNQETRQEPTNVVSPTPVADALATAPINPEKLALPPIPSPARPLPAIPDSNPQNNSVAIPPSNFSNSSNISALDNGYLERIDFSVPVTEKIGGRYVASESDTKQLVPSPIEELPAQTRVEGSSFGGESSTQVVINETTREEPQPQEKPKTPPPMQIGAYRPPEPAGVSVIKLSSDTNTETLQDHFQINVGRSDLENLIAKLR